MSEKLVILVTGASSGFGALTVRELARHGHTVFAGIFGDFPSAIEDAATFAQENNADLRTVDLDVTDEASIKAAVDDIIKHCGRLDTIVHNAGHMGVGPAESFTPEQFLHMFEINALGCHRVNRLVLPHMRRARRGHVVWVSSASVKTGGSPFGAPYFAAKAAMESLAQSYHLELTQWGIDSTIVVPGIFMSGTAHFQTAAKPADEEVLKEYSEGPYRGVPEVNMEANRRRIPPDNDPLAIAQAIRKVIHLPRGQRPYRYEGPDTRQANEGLMEVNVMADKVRMDWLQGSELSYLSKTRLNA